MGTPGYESNLAQRIETLQAAHGDQVSITDIADVVESLMTTMEGDLTAIEVQAHNELQRLVEYIRRAKSEIASIGPVDIPAQHIPAATDELDAVVQATEEATQAILDAAEQINLLSSEVEGDPALRLQEIATRIYEASNFQDITGQRITKVVKTLHYIEGKVTQLARAFGHEIDVPVAMAAPEPEGDAALLNGPQLPEKANSQDDIDALLASFD